MENLHYSQNKTKHIIELADEIIGDIELSRIGAEQILLKTVRLARLTESNDFKKWLDLEMRGYNNTELSLGFMDITGRWTDKENHKGYWVPLAEIEASINSQTIKLQSMRTPDTSGDKAFLVIDRTHAAMNSTVGNITKLKGIRSRIITLIYEFNLTIYHKKRFELTAESIFEILNKLVNL
jgi:hypothetical protein